MLPVGTTLALFYDTLCTYMGFPKQGYCVSVSVCVCTTSSSTPACIRIVTQYVVVFFKLPHYHLCIKVWEFECLNKGLVLHV